MNSFEKLTELQNQVGYKEGPINLIALFGVFGESGEVLEEWYKSVDIHSPLFDENIFDAIKQAKNIDAFKKKIRDKEVSDTSWYEKRCETSSDFDKEIADALYYLNALAINRGRSLEYYAQLSYDKVSAKIQQNIQNGIGNTEMPKVFTCKECGTENKVQHSNAICDTCEYARNK